MVKTTLLLTLGFLLGAVLMENKQYLTREIPAPMATLPDAGEYDGDIHKQRFHGNGRIRWPSGSYYEGQFKDGLFHGRGRLESPAVVYDGDFSQGDATGEGEITYKDGAVYKGDVESMLPHGYGVLEADNDRYQGSFEYGIYHGHGELILANGDRYKGGFAQGNYHGHGVYTSANGEKYTGNFQKGSFTGEGSYLQGKSRYEGMFNDWIFHGKGVYYTDKGEKYSGEFVDGQLQGAGEHLARDGSLYTGEFELFRYHGKGVLQASNGDRYEGYFQYGRYHGDGVLTYGQVVDGIKVVKGRWRNGVLIESLTPGFIQNPDTLIEKALYNQQSLLEEQWQKLAEHTPNKSDMYFLGIAGDGTEGVFRREVLFVKNYFDNYLGTKGRSTALINGSKTFDLYPLATKTSIELTLEALADRMDPDNDILFIYMTSHGSKDARFSLKQHSVRLDDLSAKRLAQMLEPLPIRWKVIVLSACYSGSFIPALKDSSTLIITAASADKASFGCHDQNEFTYFGEAYFKDALPRAKNFIDAFDKARAIIAKREQQEGLEASKPLIFRPKAVVEQLAIWERELAQAR